MNSLFLHFCYKNSWTKRLLRVFFTLFISNLVANYSIAKDQVSATQQRLDKISNIVAEIEGKLQKNIKNQSVIEKEMRELEHEIGQLHHQIAATESQISRNNKELLKLKHNSEQLAEQISQSADEFKHQIRLSYAANTQSKWKVLLSQNSLQHVGRNAIIYDYIHQARAEQFSGMQKLAVEVRDNQLAQQKTHKSLQNMLEKHTNAQSAIQKVRNEKQTIQTRLAALIATDSAQLDKEKAKQAEIKKLLSKLTLKHASGKFTQQKGKLRWPTAGKLKFSYGDARQQSSQTQWNGVLIRASKGAEIHAIYPGTVVFSDWFDHYGWLIIIDHGDGYMSLYAHAEGLYKSVDDPVDKGELIAVVGDSGDINESGLYFEIRRQGAPVDPSRWCVTPKMAYSS